MQQRLSDEQVIEHLKTHYNINVDELIRVPLGADINTCIYKAKVLKRNYFAKLIYGHEHDASMSILELLQKAKISSIIPTVLTNHGLFFQRIDNITIMVQPFIDAENCFSYILNEAQWFALGKSLRSIQEIDIPAPIKFQLRVEDFSPKWREQVKSFYHLFEGDADIGARDLVSVNLLKNLKIHKAAIHRLVKRAEALAPKHPLGSASFVLCHSDLHGGNILVNDKVLYIVDWDNPILAPKERDLMFIGGGVGNVWNNKSEVESFYKGYGNDEIDMSLLAYYRHERIVEDIAIYVQQILFTESTNRLEMYQHFIDMFADNGVVEIAFETDCL